MNAIYQTKTVIECFVEKVAFSDATSCWEWQGGTTKARTYALGGYGRFYDHGHPIVAHRWLYEIAVGPVPPGLDLDHLCRNRLCVNPDHLEPVTRRENARRGAVGQRTHCPQGHAYDDENTYVRNGVHRNCRECHRTRERERQRRMRGAQS